MDSRRICGQGDCRQRYSRQPEGGTKAASSFSSVLIPFLFFTVKARRKGATPFSAIFLRIRRLPLSYRKEEGISLRAFWNLVSDSFIYIISEIFHPRLCRLRSISVVYAEMRDLAQKNPDAL